VFAHATGAVYRTFVGGFAPSPAERQLLFGAVAPVVIPGLLAALTVAWQARRTADAAPLAALLAAAALQGTFTLRYAVIDPSAYFLPVMVVSVVALARLGAGLTEGLTSPALGRIFALAAMSMVSFAWVGSEIDHARQIAGVDAQVREAFRALPFDRGVVLWHSDSYARLRARQLLDGEKPGLVVINPAMLTWAPERRAQTLALGFDPLAGMRLESDADLAGVAGNIARQTTLPVVDFAQWWERSRGLPPTGARR
jgi:hypothetical protein